MIVCLLSSCGTSIDKAVQDVVKENYTIARLTKYENESIYGVYHITDNKNEYLIQLVNQEGYKDEIKTMVIIDYKEDEIMEIKILKHNESEKYGDLLTEDWFLKRFKGKSTAAPLTVVKMSAKKENEIVAITGATITSKAVVKAVNLCMDNYQKIKGE